MTTNDAFGRTLSTWLHEDAEHHVPDHLVEVLQRTATTRQRAAWSSLERWLPMDTTFRRPVFRPAPVGQIGLLLLIGLLIAAFVAIAVGSHRAPPPYGLARNGAVVASHDGDIYSIDPATSASSLLIGGDADFDFGPTYSRDGSKFMFLRSVNEVAEPAMLSLMVANADGSNVRELTPPGPGPDWFDWSPDGSQIVFNAAGVIHVVNVDGSGSATLPVDRPVHYVTWLPPDGAEILFRTEAPEPGDPLPGIFAIRPDGTGLRPITTKPALNRSDFQSPTVAPDGSRIAYTRWSWSGLPAIFLLDLATGVETPLGDGEGIGQAGGAAFSPDGSLLAYSRFLGDGTYQLVVAPTDGSAERTALSPRWSGSPEGTTYAFTPDGTAVLAGFGTDDDRTTFRLPVDGSQGSTLNDGGSFSFADIQRLAP